MNVFERSAMRRAERQLAPAMEPGERVLEFDIGKAPQGDQLHCIATNRAVYLVPRGGNALCLPYSTLTATQGGPSWIGLNTFSGNHYEIDFGRSSRRLSDVIVERYGQEAKKRRRFHVSWGDTGATFLVVPEGQGEKVGSFVLDNPGKDDITTSMVVEQALGELETSLGQQPSGQYAAVRPSWMPTFTWNPPLMPSHSPAATSPQPVASDGPPAHPEQPLATTAGRWIPDPTERHELRYWTGESWTEHVTDAGVPGIDPLPTSSAGRWAPDPTGRHQWRLWTGSDWTDDVNDGGTVSMDPR